MTTTDNTMYTTWNDFSNLPRWVVWRNEIRNGKLTKVPFYTASEKARANDPSTWRTRSEAKDVARKLDMRHGVGVGIMLGKVDNNLHLFEVDLDSCLRDG